jgi:hypothetical protein
MRIFIKNSMPTFSFFSFFLPLLNVLLLSFMLGSRDWLPLGSRIMPERFCWENLTNTIKASLLTGLFGLFLAVFCLPMPFGLWAFLLGFLFFCVIILKKIITQIQAYMPSY